MSQRRHKEISSLETHGYLDSDESGDNPLCICEYYNKNNQRAHLLMCCCNCEAMDSLCTQLMCFCCDPDDEDLEPPGENSFFKKRIFQLAKETLLDIHDRLRVPYPGGAKKLDLDFFLTLASILIYILVGTISFSFSLFALLLLPLLIYPRFFKIRQAKDKNVKIAFYLVLNSLLLTLLVFNLSLIEELNMILNKSEIYLFNFSILTALALLFYLKTSNPGCIKQNKEINSNSSEGYCKKCNIKKETSLDLIGHCPQCDRCIFKRDHHCFWVDNCIGYLNHKIFILFLIHLLGVFLYSFLIIKRRLETLECSLYTFWYDKSTINEPKAFSCLFDVYYSNFNRALLSLLFIQLIPLISYMILLILQQSLFISLGLTQYQLFRMSQRNVRFSLAIYLGENFRLNTAVDNLFNFVTKIRTESNLQKAYYNQKVAEYSNHNHIV